jgi:hypothetical protein
MEEQDGKEANAVDEPGQMLVMMPPQGPSTVDVLALTEPGDMDIVCGRGKNISLHAGNQVS